MFDPGDDNTDREDMAIATCIEIANDWVNDRLASDYSGDRLERMELLAACHVLHGPYPHEDSVQAGDSSADFAGRQLGNAGEMLDKDGLRETRYGRMLLMADTNDTLVSDVEGALFESYGV